MNDAQVRCLFAKLAAANPQPASELVYSSVFELLAAVLLSAQATDVGVNKATRRLFAVATRIGGFRFASGKSARSGVDF
mgnify:CR=1 FL=1